MLLLAAMALGLPALAYGQPGELQIDPAVRTSESERVATIKTISPAVLAVCKYGGDGAGSGVVISPDGYALTNVHVVAGTGPVMSCGMSDGLLYDGVLVGLDRVGDVALIKLLPREKDRPFPFVALGDSDLVKPGDWSLAMGNPFSVALDFKPTVTYGLVSGTNRYQPPAGNGQLEYTDCIQVDTSINPGNSGGPLFNMKGELIGINGRISLEKRGRVNVGVGYAISINQIKNFLGHLQAGLDADHATLGAEIRTADEDKELNKLVVTDVLSGSDADRRGLQTGDQLIRFGTTSRFMSTTNHYKNILGIYPKGWRVPLTYKRGREAEKEILVRLQGLMPTAKSRDADGEPKGPQPLQPGSTPGSAAAKLYQPKRGFANYYFNQFEQDRVLAGLKKHGDFAGVAGTWVAEGTYQAGQRNGDMRFEISEDKGPNGSPLVTLKMNVDQQLAPLTETDARKRAEPIGSGGLMIALYQWHHFLTAGPKGFEGGFDHQGSEPFYPRPADGTEPKSLADVRVEADVIRTKHGAPECRWYFDKKDRRLLGFETSLTKDDDPCEVYFSDYKPVADGRTLPHRIEVRKGDARFCLLVVNRYTLQTK
jgi:S1-C subfamily serine protease